MRLSLHSDATWKESNSFVLKFKSYGNFFHSFAFNFYYPNQSIHNTTLTKPKPVWIHFTHKVHAGRRFTFKSIIVNNIIFLYSHPVVFRNGNPNQFVLMCPVKSNFYIFFVESPPWPNSCGSCANETVTACMWVCVYVIHQLANLIASLAQWQRWNLSSITSSTLECLNSCIDQGVACTSAQILYYLKLVKSCRVVA